MKQHRLINRLGLLDASVNFIFCIDFKGKTVTVSASRVEGRAEDRYSNTLSVYTKVSGWGLAIAYEEFMGLSEKKLCLMILKSYKEYANAR